MSRLIYIKAFNDLLDQFLDYLSDSFPDFKSDILLTRTATEFIRSGSPNTAVDKFLQYVLPYEKQIQDCNEDFFLRFEKNLTLDNDSVLFGLKLRNIWLSDNMNDLKKARIWLFFHRMINAARKASG